MHQKNMYIDFFVEKIYIPITKHNKAWVKCVAMLCCQEVFYDHIINTCLYTLNKLISLSYSLISNRLSLYFSIQMAYGSG